MATRKRPAQGEEQGSFSKGRPGDAREKNDLQFQDEFEDEIEEDEIVEEVDEENDGERQEEEEQEMETDQQRSNMMYRPGVDNMDEGEEMDYDNSAYIMLHRLNVEYPFLSFDFVRDPLGEMRTKFPKTAFMVGGTQASSSDQHALTVMKMSDMHKTYKDRLEEVDSDEESDDSDDEGVEDDAIVDFRVIRHTGAVNRVRSMPQHPNIVASWSEAGRVYMWDISRQLASMGYNGVPVSSAQDTVPMYAFKGHKDEGYALAWSSVKAGRMASGDCKRAIYTWQVGPAGDCSVDDTSFQGHSKSVEDLAWSPSEESVFASCSVDLSVRIWDVRERKRSMLQIQDAHTEDVNVISWNPKVAFLLASGSDDGSIKVWDLRMLKPQQTPAPVGHFKWHQGSITSLSWHPHDDTVLAASGSDNQVSVWDFGLEEDPEQAALVEKNAKALAESATGADGERIDLPPQLLFLHQGQTDIKEVVFHPQIPGMLGSTAADGFHVWIPEPLDPKTTAKYLS